MEACGVKALLGTAFPSTETQHRHSCFRISTKAGLCLGNTHWELVVSVSGGSAWKFLTSSLSCLRQPDHPICRACLLGPLAHQAVNLRRTTEAFQCEQSSLSFYRASCSLPKASFPNRHHLLFLFSALVDKTQASLPGLHPAVLLSPASSSPISATKAA